MAGRPEVTFSIVFKWHRGEGAADDSPARCGHPGHYSRHRLRHDEIGPFTAEQAECQQMCMSKAARMLLLANDLAEEADLNAFLKEMDRREAEWEVWTERAHFEAERLVQGGRLPPYQHRDRVAEATRTGLYSIYGMNQATELLGVTPEQLTDAADAGQLEMLHLYDDPYFPLSALEAYAVAAQTPRRPHLGSGLPPAILELAAPVQLYTLDEVADLLALPRAIVDGWIDTQELAVIELGGQSRVSAAELGRFIEARTRPAR